MYDDFIEKLYDTFSEARRPTKEEMTIYKDFECAEIMEKFSPHKNCDLPDKTIDEYNQGLLWLRPIALRHYLPRYLEYSLINPDTQVAEFTLYTLSTHDSEFYEERFIMFTDKEKDILVEYLKLYRTTLEGFDIELFEKDIQRGLEIWTKKT